MHYLDKRKRKEQKEFLRKFFHKAIGISINIALTAMLAVLFAWATINWISDCCKPGGECFPARLYPQCVEVQKEVPGGN